MEECLTGEEVSFIALSDGRNVLPLEPTQDHKAAYDNDTGPTHCLYFDKQRNGEWEGHLALWMEAGSLRFKEAGGMW